MAFSREAQLSHPVCVAEIDVLEASLQDCDGMIGYFMGGPVEKVRSLELPVINVANVEGPLEGMGNFLSDDVAVGRLAAEHLVSQGYQHFCLLAAEASGRAHEDRAQGFCDHLEAAGHSVQRLSAPTHFPQDQPWTRLRYVSKVSAILEPDLLDLEPGIGFFATNDWLGWALLTVLHDLHPALLPTFGVLGVDNLPEHIWYGPHLPTLSSVVPAFSQMGREALAALAAHPGPEGKEAVARLRKRFPPLGIATRASTEGGASRDPLTSQMARWIWERFRAGQPVNVDDLAGHFHMSRKSSYRLFHQHLECSPSDWIDQTRIQMARHLLAHTRMPIGEISEYCGYSKQDVLSRRIRETEDCTPREFRARRLIVPFRT